MGKLEKTYEPSAPEVAVRTKPVAVWVTWTVAPVTGKPVESLTAPLICAVVPCPQTNAAARKSPQEVLAINPMAMPPRYDFTPN